MDLRSFAKAALLLVSLAFAMPAAAKDICVQDQDDHYWHFTGVKKLKPGRVVDVSGIILISGAPVGGKATVTDQGTVLMWLSTFVTNQGAMSGITAAFTGDANFTGSGTFDFDGDNASDQALTFTNVDCKDVP